MQINIDKSAGFCWGVVRTIEKVEECLLKYKDEKLYILGEIIHNPSEIERLAKKGLKTITHADLPRIAPEKPKVIIRAHGEPPQTYLEASRLGIELIDATCPLVTALQKRVRKYYTEGWQIVIFGKRDHAEIIGIRGVCNDECIVIANPEEALEKIGPGRKTVLFSQTTMDKRSFNKIKELLEDRSRAFVDAGHFDGKFQAKDTICKYVYGREEALRSFAAENDVILFVAGKSSSNGKSLYKVCSSMNSRTHFIEDVKEIDYGWLDNIEKIGITGATSTPQWYLAAVKTAIEEHISKNNQW